MIKLERGAAQQKNAAGEQHNTDFVVDEEAAAALRVSRMRPAPVERLGWTSLS
jgi:hypothetical protein